MPKKTRHRLFEVTDFIPTTTGLEDTHQHIYSFKEVDDLKTLSEPACTAPEANGQIALPSGTKESSDPEHNQPCIQEIMATYSWTQI